MGIFDHEDDQPGVDSIEIPSGDISRFLSRATKFLEALDDAKPGLSDFIERFW